jgi:tol-pal system protein YbgF
MRMKFLFSTLLLCLVAHVSFAVDEKTASTPASPAEDKVERLEKSLNALQKQMYTQGSGEITSNARLNATTLAQLEEMKEQLKSLRGDLEQIQFDNARLNEKMVKFAADMEFRFNELEKNKQSGSKDKDLFDDIDEELDNDLILSESDAKSKGKASKTEEVIEKTDPLIEKKMREKGMEDKFKDAHSLLKEKDYKGARAAFQAFVKEYPDTDQAGNAYYWIGETYFTRAEYDKAAIEYLKGYQSSIRGSRAADNLLKLGKSMSKLEKRKEACTTFAKMKKEFPNAANTLKKQCDEEMKNLRCNPS